MAVALLERDEDLSAETGGWMTRIRPTVGKPERCRFKDIAIGEHFWAVKKDDQVEREYVKLPKGMYFSRSRREVNAQEAGSYRPASFGPEEWVIRHPPVQFQES